MKEPHYQALTAMPIRCSAFALNGNPCKNFRGLIEGLCSKHRTDNDQVENCTALLTKGARKGQACGARAVSLESQLCKRHATASVVTKVQSSSYVGMLFKIEENGEHMMSLFGSFPTMEACVVVGKETLESFEGKAEEIEMPTVSGCVASWAIGENIQVCVVKIAPHNPTVAAPRESPKASPQKPKPKVAKKASVPVQPCAFIITRGKRKGDECGKKATVSGFCTKHQPAAATPKPSAMDDLLVEGIEVEKHYFSSPQIPPTPPTSVARDDSPAATLKLSPNQTPLSTRDLLEDLNKTPLASPDIDAQNLLPETLNASPAFPTFDAILDTDDVAFVHRKENLTLFFDVILPEEKAQYELTLKDGTHLERMDEKFILSRPDKTFKGATLYEAYNNVIRDMDFDVSIVKVYYTGKSVRVDTADN